MDHRHREPGGRPSRARALPLRRSRPWPFIQLVVALAFGAGLSACVSPTPYRAASTDGTGFGYTSIKLTDQLYRIRFLGTRRTPHRWVDAFLLYRAAEVAREANAPAFQIVEGQVDASVLTGEDVFGHVDLDADFTVTTIRRAAPAQDDTVGHEELAAGMRYTAGGTPVFRMPRPQPQPKYKPPVLIYTPGAVATPLPDRTLLVELRQELKADDGRGFVTAEVLDKLGTRIKRAAPAPAPTPPDVQPSSL